MATPRPRFEDALRQYGWLCDIAVSRYFAPGLTHDDILQEAHIGLWAACRDFNPDHGSPFGAFARTCINRQVITALKAATRGKHRPLNESCDLHQPPTESVLSLAERIDSGEPTALDELAGRDDLARISDAMVQLSDLEQQAIIGVALNGRTYAAVAAEAFVERKQIDNAVQRGREKLRAALDAA
jgi:RNA polymerase sporulation-specific sigma factor